MGQYAEQAIKNSYNSIHHFFLLLLLLLVAIIRVIEYHPMKVTGRTHAKPINKHYHATE